MKAIRAAQAACRIRELRQYTLHPRACNRLVDLFEREFIEPRKAVGMTVIGQFLDLDDPDHFVWLHGFAACRHQPLQRFPLQQDPAVERTGEIRRISPAGGRR